MRHNLEELHKGCINQGEWSEYARLLDRRILTNGAGSRGSVCTNIPDTCALHDAYSTVIDAYFPVLDDDTMIQYDI